MIAPRIAIVSAALMVQTATAPDEESSGGNAVGRFLAVTADTCGYANFNRKLSIKECSANCQFANAQVNDSRARRPRSLQRRRRRGRLTMMRGLFVGIGERKQTALVPGTTEDRQAGRQRAATSKPHRHGDRRKPGRRRIDLTIVARQI